MKQTPSKLPLFEINLLPTDRSDAALEASMQGVRAGVEFLLKEMENLMGDYPLLRDALNSRGEQVSDFLSRLQVEQMKRKNVPLSLALAKSLMIGDEKNEDAVKMLAEEIQSFIESERACRELPW